MSKKLAENKFAVMRWLTDNNRLSVHDLNYVSSPKMPLDDYKPGMCGLAVFVGFSGLWEFRILNVGGKKEMTSWLKTEFLSLTADPTDKFLGENKVEDKRENKDQKENEELLVLRRSPRKFVKSDVTPKKRQVHVEELEGSAAVTPKKRHVHVEESEGSALASAHSPQKSGKSDVTPKKRHVEKTEGSSKSARAPNKLLQFEGTPESNQYLSNRVHGSSRKDVSGEKIKRLEEDVKSLRRKYRKLEERIEELEKTSRTGKLVNESSADSLATPESATVELDHTVQQPKVVDKTATQDTTSEADIEAVVAKGVGVHNKFKNLCLHFFTTDELCSGTRTGKRTIKCMEDVKPQLNQTRFQQLESCVVSKFTLFDKETFIKKFENLQKVLRREQKKD